jgi:hypothetical protein
MKAKIQGVHGSSDKEMFHGFCKELNMGNAVMLKETWSPKFQTGPGHTVDG